jgi:hypothetical protein
MALTWDIVTVESNIETGACTDLHWTAIDFVTVEGVTKAGRRYGCETVTSDPSAEGFIAFADVTKENCIAWVKESLGSEKVSGIETEIANALSEFTNPTLNTTNPWDSGGD